MIEFMKIIGPLTDPTAHGGRPEDAFHVVAPSLPGHGFSDKPTATGAIYAYSLADKATGRRSLMKLIALATLGLLPLAWL